MKRLLIEPLDALMFRSERPFTVIESHVAKLGVISPITFEGAIKSKIFLEFCLKRNYLPSDFQRRKKKEETENEVERSLKELIGVVKEKIDRDKELSELLELIGHPVKVVKCEIDKLLRVMKNPPLNYPSRLNVSGAFFAEKEKMVEHFPIPNDIVREDRNGGEIVKLKPSEKIKMNTDLFAAFSDYSKINPMGGLIELDELRKYLHGEIPRIKKVKWKEKDKLISNPYLEEIRIGIQLEKGTKQTAKGALYAAEFLRLLEEWGFVVWYEAEDIEKYLKDEEIIRLGGEGRGAICKKIKEIDVAKELKIQELIEQINKDKKFKLYLAAPSYFGNNACKPSQEELKGKLGIKDLKLVSALPGKPVYIGGYDFALNREKSLRRWVNAGAVYYYEFVGGKIKEDLNTPIQIFDKNIDMRCAFIGRW